MAKLADKTRKALVAFVGWSVLLLGAVMIPYPGPGWVVVFIGLSILAREFQWASDVHAYTHSRYHAWQKWLRAQPMYIKAIFWLLTAMTVVVTVWLVNGYGIMSAWFNLGWDWLNSPFVK